MYSVLAPRGFLAHLLSAAPYAAVPGTGIIDHQCILRHIQKLTLMQNGTPGKSRAVCLREQRLLQLLPVQQIAAHCMPPAHIVPLNAKRIVLKIQMIASLIPARSADIIHPSAFRCKMNPWLKWLCIWQELIRLQKRNRPVLLMHKRQYRTLPSFYRKLRIKIRCPGSIIHKKARLELQHCGQFLVKPHIFFDCIFSDRYPKIIFFN